VCGIAFGNPMNLTTGIAVYASVCKELGLPFRFPGRYKNSKRAIDYSYLHYIRYPSVFYRFIRSS
jgi:hypothetical protein